MQVEQWLRQIHICPISIQIFSNEGNFGSKTALDYSYTPKLSACPIFTGSTAIFPNGKAGNRVFA